MTAGLEARRIFLFAHLFIIQLFSHTISGRLEGLINIKDACRSSPFWLTLPSRCPISDFDVRAIEGLIVHQKASQCAFCSFQCGRLCHRAKFPLLRELSRYGGVLCEEQILILVIPTIRVHWVGPKNKPRGQAGGGRNHCVKKPLGLREELSSSIPTVRNRAVVNSSRNTMSRV